MNDSCASTPGSCEPHARDFDFEMFRYQPSLVGAIIAIVTFSILGALHAWQWFRTKQIIILCVVLGALGKSDFLPAFFTRYSNLYNLDWGSHNLLQARLLATEPGSPPIMTTKNGALSSLKASSFSPVPCSSLLQYT